MGEVFVFWVAFSTIAFVAVLTHCVIVRSAREESKHEKAMPRGWLRDVERRDWSGEEQGVVINMPPRVLPRVPPRVPPEAHVRN
ncbi:hypothetical protein INS49_015858 [Diaporthe citri]|uniref:uncharacterized protein n=1 Tax=Diaporthe citri TaxID=83186 RepID=UPI001C7E3679|nr:uncharacterized protein INS49_015858 [Diaporthe citri]KAG6356470.1 hypothetical protein INS49_015858 [Diaporthe citri]